MCISQRISETIREVPDFPIPGIMFKDITPVLSAPELMSASVQALAEKAQKQGAEVIVGVESRGFLWGVPIALSLGLPFVPVRKPGKLPAESWSVAYSLEYGEARLEMHKDALSSGQRAWVIDDLLATGGTALAACQLIEQAGANVCGLGFVVELDFLEGRNKLASYTIDSLLIES